MIERLAELPDHARERIDVQANAPCWEWAGALMNGYGQLSRGPQRKAHRFVYETLVGPVGHGLMLHHECRNKRCCNPEHLTPVSRSEHAREHRPFRPGRKKRRVQADWNLATVDPSYDDMW